MSKAIAKADNVTSINPLILMEKAVQNNVAPEALEKLMALQERWEANEARKQFYAAMHDFQAIKPKLVRSSKVKFNTSKGTTEYNFCALEDIQDALKGPLGTVGLSYRFQNFTEGGQIGVRCIVSHISGHSEATPMLAPADDSGNKNKIQGIGSTTTYLQRYTLISAFGLTSADDDDDGTTSGDMPYLMLLKHMQVVRDNWDVISAIKQAVDDKDYYNMAMYMDQLADETKNALWMAPTRGGVFTTAEIAAFKTNEYANARADYFAEKGEANADQV